VTGIGCNQAPFVSSQSDGRCAQEANGSSAFSLHVVSADPQMTHGLATDTAHHSLSAERVFAMQFIGAP
jgi:hypothetical protein